MRFKNLRKHMGRTLVCIWARRMHSSLPLVLIMQSQEGKTDGILPSQFVKKHTISDDLLYIGIDIGKRSCVAGFVSQTLLARYAEFEQCPAISFDQSLEGFEKLLDQIVF